VEEKKDEHIEASQTLQREKGKQVINDTSSSATSNSETPYEPRAPFPERLKAPSHFGKHGEKIKAMMEVFKQVKINIPPRCHLASACLRQIPQGFMYSEKEIQKSHSQESPSYLACEFLDSVQHPSQV
jgi:hypothetical protein